MKQIVLYILLFVAHIPLSAQANLTVRLDSLLGYFATYDKFMGCLQITKGEDLLYHKAYGFISNSDTIYQKTTTATKYRIGSITKMFTATMIFQLIEKKKINLTDKLAAFYPAIPNSDKITINDLLYHRSGLRNYTNDSLYQNYYKSPKSKKEMLGIIKKMPIDAEPDKQTAYSNTNYLLLGYIIEKVTKKSYADNLKRLITDKIKLRDTYFDEKMKNNIQEACSYTMKDGDWEDMPKTHLSVAYSAGGIVSTTSDLTKFIRALFSLELINQRSLDAMVEIKGQFGRGIFSTPFFEHVGYGHTGKIDGFNSVLTFFPEENVAVAFCCNGMNYFMNDILIGIMSTYYDKPYPFPTFDTIDLSDEQLNVWVGRYAKEGFPLKIDVRVENHQLIAQATGQAAFPLEAVSETEFKFDRAGVRLLFSKELGTMTLKQGSNIVEMKRE